MKNAITKPLQPLAARIKRRFAIGKLLALFALSLASISAAAATLTLAPTLEGKGQSHEIDDALYPPIEQGAVITAQGTKNALSQKFVNFLHSEKARAILVKFGFGIPK